MSAAILPGRTIGIFGSGQLGRMMTIAARRLGYAVHVYSPDRGSPAGQLADVERTAPYDDAAAVGAFVAGVDVVTFEFENVPAAPVAAAAAGRSIPVRPSADVLHALQHRGREKRFLADLGVPVAAFEEVDSLVALKDAVHRLGVPVVVKTSRLGYDGRGQVRLRSIEPTDVAAAWQAIGRVPAIVERFVTFDRELSVVAARGADGAFADFGAFENRHERHILDLATAPADVPTATAAEAIRLTRRIATALDLVGVLCVEFFLTGDSELVVNEVAPRPHNSGHLTIDACVTSQFEQHVRAVCGLPLGGTRQLAPAAMANLLGDLWEGGEPDWARLLGWPEVRLHLYGKREARPGRKMGHLTSLGRSAAEAAAVVSAARAVLARRSVQPPAI